MEDITVFSKCRFSPHFFTDLRPSLPTSQSFNRSEGTRHYPAHCLVLNCTPPTATKPIPLDSEAVIFCFHEMGGGGAIHHLNSRGTHARFHRNTPRHLLDIPSRSKLSLIHNLKFNAFLLSFRLWPHCVFNQLFISLSAVFLAF